MAGGQGATFGQTAPAPGAAVGLRSRKAALNDISTALSGIGLASTAGSFSQKSTSRALTGSGITASTGSLAGSMPLNDDWTSRSTASGVTQAKRFTTATDVTNWIHPDADAGQASFDPGDGIIGDGCLKINYPAEQANSSASWRVPLNTAWTTDAQGFGSTPFYILYACKISPGKLVPSSGGGGFKFSIVGEYRVSSPGSSVSAVNNEVVVQNTNYRGALQAYRQDGSGFPGFYDETTLPGETMLQNAVDHGAGVSDPYERYCLYQGGNASAGCWMIPEGVWFWVKQRIEIPSRGGSAGNKFDLWAALATDTQWSHLIHFEDYLIGNGGGVTPLGPNGLWLLPYDTGRTSASYDAWHKYDQVIVSTSDIALPSAIPAIPYALPDAGETVTVTGDTIQDVKPAAFSTSQIDYSIYNSYGFGISNPYYSRYGAMCVGGTGGHMHPDFTGQFAWDASTGDFVLHEHGNGGTRYGGQGGDLGYFEYQTNGSPYYEISGSSEVPSPPHPYQNAVLRPPSLGGGRYGSFMYVGHCALHINGINHSKTVHSYDFDTDLWERVTNNVLSSRMSYDTAVIFDEKRSRYWIFPQGAEGDQFVTYLDATDWSFNSISIGTWPACTEIGNGGCGFMYRDYLFIQLSDGRLACIDPDDIPGNFSYVTISGSTLPSHRNLFEYFPQTNKFYWAPTTGGTTLNRLTPPSGNPKTGTWTHDTITVSPGLTAQTTSGDPGNVTGHYHALMYLEKINRLAWFPGGTNPVQLIYPT